MNEPTRTVGYEPAFPAGSWNGLVRRDYFAAVALQGLLTSVDSQPHLQRGLAGRDGLCPG